MYIILALINFLLFIVFGALVLTLICKGKKMFANKYGNVFIIIFAIAFIGISNAEEENFKQEDHHYYGEEDLSHHNGTFATKRIEDNLLYDLLLTVDFKEDANKKLVPVDSRVQLTGLSCGYIWEYDGGVINRVDDTTFTYNLSGRMHWYVMGVELYVTSQNFEGTISVDTL